MSVREKFLRITCTFHWITDNPLDVGCLERIASHDHLHFQANLREYFSSAGLHSHLANHPSPSTYQQRAHLELLLSACYVSTTCARVKNSWLSNITLHWSSFVVGYDEPGLSMHVLGKRVAIRGVSVLINQYLNTAKLCIVIQISCPSELQG